jgi:hypothetical protein
MNGRPLVVKVNRAAWKRRHLLRIDGRLFYVITPVFLCGIGTFFDFRMVVFPLIAFLIWCAGVVQWKMDEWMIDRYWIELNSPRIGPAND